MSEINILGTIYTIHKDIDEKDDSRLKTRNGYCDFSVKKIVVAKIKRDEDTIDDIESYLRKILRHEIIHTFLFESGLWGNSINTDSWATNEEMTDWIAIQYPKIQKVFKQLNIEE